VSYPEPFKSELNPSGTIRKHSICSQTSGLKKAFEGAKSIVPGTDLVIVRENTQGFYADRNTFAGTGEFMPDANTAIAMGIITSLRGGEDRQGRLRAGAAAPQQGHHRAQGQRAKLTTGCSATCAARSPRIYPDVELDDFHIDAMTVPGPQRRQVRRHRHQRTCSATSRPTYRRDRWILGPGTVG
jgi:3-isopropylmalate dehydrogenase